MGLTVTALGTGVCTDTQQTKALRQPPGFLVQVDGMNILLDCSEGIRFRLKALGIDPWQVAHVAVSHAHPDHAALPQFIQSSFCNRFIGLPGQARPVLSIYLPTLLARDFPQVWNWHQPENGGRYWDNFEPKIIGMKDGYSEQIAPGITLKAFSVYHGFGRHPAMGFRLETKYGTVAYSGDTGLCDAVRTIAQDADLFICDCSVRIGQEYTGGYGHMGPRQCGDVASKSKAKRLWLTHYFDLDTPELMLSEVREGGFFGESTVAKDGEVWKVL